MLPGILCTICPAPTSAPGRLRGGGRESMLTVAPQQEEEEVRQQRLGSKLMRVGLSLQGHLNWPPFCLVMLNVTHLTHQVTIDRFSRKVSASESQSFQGCDQASRRASSCGEVLLTTGGQGQRGTLPMKNNAKGSPHLFPLSQQSFSCAANCSMSENYCYIEFVRVFLVV